MTESNASHSIEYMHGEFARRRSSAQQPHGKDERGYEQKIDESAAMASTHRIHRAQEGTLSMVNKEI